jgi:hypothetical protein
VSAPLRSVLSAFEGGASTLDDVRRRTGLDREVVEAAVDHLVRMGRISATSIASGCPDGGCGSCASGSQDGAPGCGSAGPSAARRGPVLVGLSLRRPR